MMADGFYILNEDLLPEQWHLVHLSLFQSSPIFLVLFRLSLHPEILGGHEVVSFSTMGTLLTIWHSSSSHPFPGTVTPGISLVPFSITHHLGSHFPQHSVSLGWYSKPCWHWVKHSLICDSVSISPLFRTQVLLWHNLSVTQLWPTFTSS